MEIIHKAMRGGKTTELVQWLRADRTRKMVVMRASERDRLIHHYQLNASEAQRVIVAARNVLRGLRGDVAVDNGEWLLNQFLGRPVNVVSFTK